MLTDPYITMDETMEVLHSLGMHGFTRAMIESGFRAHRVAVQEQDGKTVYRRRDVTRAIALLRHAYERSKEVLATMSENERTLMVRLSMLELKLMTLAEVVDALTKGRRK